MSRLSVMSERLLSEMKMQALQRMDDSDTAGHDETPEEVARALLDPHSLKESDRRGIGELLMRFIRGLG